MIDMRQLVKRIFFCALIFVVAGILARDGQAASTVALESSGNGVYTLQGIGMENAASMDIIVVYDPATLTKPRVSQGSLISGALMAVNDAVAGQVRMGIIRTTPVQGTGAIATLTFDPAGSGPGKILSLTAKLTNLNSKPLETVAQISGATDSAAVSADGAAKTDTAASGNSVAAVDKDATLTAVGGVVTQPGAPAPEQQKEQIASNATATTDLEQGKAGAAESAAASPGAAGMTASAEEPKNIKQFTSVLDRFREYRGERTVKALTALFQRSEPAPAFRQEPPVLISDGKATAKIIFMAASPVGATPDFALKNARLISMKRYDDRLDTWVAEIKPEKGAYAASMIVSLDNAMREYPLTLAPKVVSDSKSPGKFTEKAFRLYLSGRGRDLNRDGKRDYIDDYIYATNYVAEKSGP